MFESLTLTLTVVVWWGGFARAGLLVSIVILRQGLGLFAGSFNELTDAGASPATMRTLSRALDAYVVQQSFPSPTSPSSTSTSSPSPDHPHPYLRPLPTLKIHTVRAKRSGSQLFVDLVADVPGDLSVEETAGLERRIGEVLKREKKEIVEVSVRFRPIGT